MIQAIDLISRDGKILWDCGLNVPPGEEGEIIFDKKNMKSGKCTISFFFRSEVAENVPLFKQGELSSL